MSTQAKPIDYTIALEDLQLAQRAIARDGNAFRNIMKKNNQLLYRIARGIVRNDGEAEDIVQESYVRAFSQLGNFRGESTLATWLSRIVINEALGRLRKKRTHKDVSLSENQSVEAQIIQFPNTGNNVDPERHMAQRQILKMVEDAADALPDVYRMVFVMRLIEGLNVEESAKLLRIRPETVKTRLYRARALVSKRLAAQIGPVLLDAFPFAGRRCERFTNNVMDSLGFFD